MKKNQPGDLINIAARLSVDGGFSKALHLLRLAAQANGDDATLTVEQGVMLAADGLLADEAELDREVDLQELSDHAKARYFLARALIKYNAKRREEARSDISRAIELDGDYALARNMLCRHYLFFDRDPVRAKGELEVAAILCPDALGPSIDLINLEIEGRDCSNAFHRARDLLRRHPFQARSWAAFLVSLISKLPWSGRVLTLPILFAMFVPFLGPAVLMLWVLFCTITYVSLRRTHGAIATIPFVMLLMFLSAFLLKWILFKRVWP